MFAKKEFCKLGLFANDHQKTQDYKFVTEKKHVLTWSLVVCGAFLTLYCKMESMFLWHRMVLLPGRLENWPETNILEKNRAITIPQWALLKNITLKIL